MPRYARLFLPGLPLHIVQRGHDRKAVFVEPGDCQYYLENITEAKDRYDVSVHAYCLMTNHVHLLISRGPEASGISAFMRVLAARQTRYVNKRESRTGPYGRAASRQVLSIPPPTCSPATDAST